MRTEQHHNVSRSENPPEAKAPTSPATVRFAAAGPWGLGLALFYAIFVRFYQAAGGRIGLPGQIDDVRGFQSASYGAGLLIVVGGTACMFLTRTSWHRYPKWLPRRGGQHFARGIVAIFVAVPCGMAGVFSTAHGIAGELTNLFELLGWISIDKPLFEGADAATTRAGDLWNILLYEPWFFAMGVSLLLATRHFAMASGCQKRAVRRFEIGAATVTLGIVLFAVVTVCLGIVVSTD